MKHSEAFGDIDPLMFDLIDKFIFSPLKTIKDKKMKNPKKNIIFYFNIEFADIVNNLPNFKPLYDYFKQEDNIDPAEWGKLVFDDIEIKLYGSSEIKYRFEELYP